MQQLLEIHKEVVLRCCITVSELLDVNLVKRKKIHAYLGDSSAALRDLGMEYTVASPLRAMEHPPSFPTMKRKPLPGTSPLFVNPTRPLRIKCSAGLCAGLWRSRRLAFTPTRLVGVGKPGIFVLVRARL